MEIVKISSKYQLVIPGKIRKKMGIKPGELLKVIVYNGRIELIPLKPIQELNGFLKGIDTQIDRNEDRI
jgi:AbrB family looped-hinge helix DNA binding protein